MNEILDLFSEEERYYKIFCDDCNKTLQRLEKCFYGVKESSNITSYYFGLLHLWLELTSTLISIKIIQNNYTSDALFLYFNSIEFEKWAKKMRSYSRQLKHLDPLETVDLRFEIKEGELYPTNEEADNYIFGVFKDYIRYGNTSMENDLRAKVRQLSESMFPKIVDLRHEMDINLLIKAISGFFVFLSDLLLKLDRDFNQPDYKTFEELCNAFLLEFDAYLYSNKNTIYSYPPINLDLSKEKLIDNIDKIYKNLILSENCNEEHWDQIFEQGQCNPNNEIIGELIFNQRKKEDRIKRAFDILYNIKLCVLLKAADLRQESLQEIKNRFSHEKVCSIPDNLRGIMQINDEAFEKFIDIVRNDMPKYTEKQKYNWDILCYLCQCHKIIGPRMRTQFSELLVAISPNLGSAQTLRSNMEKCPKSPPLSLDLKKGYAKLINDPIAQAIDKLIQPLIQKDSE